MKALKTFAALGAGLCLFAAAGNAQMPGGSPAGLNAAMMKLFDHVPGFTSKAEVRLQEKSPPSSTSMAVDFAMLAGKVRMDLDMAALKSKQMPPETLAGFKAAGLDKLATVVRPDRKSTLLIYPSVQSYAEMPMSKEEAAGMDRKFKIQKTLLGRETIDRHDCEKNKVVLSADTGEKHEATVWYAADLKNFPVRIQMEQPQMTVVLEYRDVKLIQPEAGRFEPPAGFTKYPTVEHLMQNAMMKMMGVKKSQ